METRKRSMLTVWALVTAILCSSSLAEANKLLAVKSTALPADGRLVTISTAEQPTFTVFRLYDPMRVVIDVSSGDISNFNGPVTVDDGIVGDVAFRQFKAGNRTIGRVTINVLKNMRYEVNPRGNAIEVKLLAEGSNNVVVGSVQPPAPPLMDRQALAAAQKAKAEAEAASASAQKERAEAVRLQEELTARRHDLAKQQAQLEEQRRAAQAAEDEANKLQEKLHGAVAAERKAIKADLEKANQQKQAADEAYAKMAVERAQMEDTVTALKAQQQRSEAAAKAAEMAAREKLNNAEKALAQANKTNEDLAARLAKAEEEKNQAQAERDALQKSQAAAEQERQDVASKLAAEQNEVAALKKSLAEQQNAKQYSPATVRRIFARNNSLVISFSDKLPRYESQLLTNPARLVLDLDNTSRAPALPLNHQVSVAAVKRVRLGEHPDHLRVVLDLAANGTNYRLEEENNNLVVVFSGRNSFDTGADNSSFAAKGRVSDVTFHKNAGYAKVVIATNSRLEYQVDDTPDHAYLLTIKGATIDADAERALDTTSFNSSVSMVSAYQESRNPPVVKVLVNVTEKGPYTINYHGGQLVWEIADSASVMPQSGSAKGRLSTPGATGSYSANAATMAQSTMVAAPSSQKRITIDLKDADVVNVIRLIAEVSGENIITSDNVGGKVTLKLRNVPWEQALDLILATKGYGKVRTNNIIRIAPSQDLQKEKEIELNRRKADQLVTDPVKKVLLVNYAKASELKSQLLPMLSERGTIQESERKNALIINELPDKIDEVIALAKALDTPTPQVLIEARIVEASSSYLRQLGIQWGGNAARSPAYGNATGLSFPNTLLFTGAADDQSSNQTGGVLTPANYAVNLPAPIGSGSGGGIGISFGNVSGSAMLSLRLSALEESGAARLISAPRIATLDNQKAKIEQGIDIPISVVSSAGVNTRFVSASLELEVEPHVTNDGAVMMQIKVAKNSPDFSNTGASGDPTIQKKTAETQVLVPDGDTTVIGGIYTRSTSKNTNKVPFLSKIPILGYLFRSTREEDTRAELLVFITPRILNRDTALNNLDDFDFNKNGVEK